HVLGRYRAVGLELVQPVAGAVLRLDQRAARCRDGPVEHRFLYEAGTRGAGGERGVAFRELSHGKRRSATQWAELRSRRRSSRCARGDSEWVSSGAACCRGSCGAPRAASGSPAAAKSNNRRSTQLWRTAALLNSWVTATAACEILTSAPRTKPGV